MPTAASFPANQPSQFVPDGAARRISAPYIMQRRGSKMFAWFFGLNKVAKIATYVGAILTVIVTGASAWGIVEPIMPAHRGYVRSTEGDAITPVMARLIVAQLDIDREKRERLLRESKDRELELTSPDASNTPQYKALLQERLDAIKGQLQQLDDDDKNLTTEQRTK
jgi:hypothetical protein